MSDKKNMSHEEINELVFACCEVLADRLPQDLRRRLSVADIRELIETLINKPEQVIRAN